MPYQGTSRRYLERLTHTLNEVDHAAFDAGIAMIGDAWLRGAQIIALGNGGSAMTAQHFVTDWGKMVRLSTGRALNARSLVDNIGLLTAYGNDLSYADIFVEQLKDIMKPSDLVVAISGSGNSENVIRAVEYANAKGAYTLGLCGYSGGRLKGCAQQAIWVNVDDMQLCEDAHAIFGHIVLKKLCSSGGATRAYDKSGSQYDLQEIEGSIGQRSA
jgi:D-sedoheptulose 7-phosphate isomerase